jgi:hypothetical protein
MPTARTSPQTTVNFVAFLQLDLTDTDIAAIDSSVVTPEDLLLFIAGILHSGYRLAGSHDITLGRVKLTLMDVDPTRSSAGYMLSAEATDFTGALTVLHYKHTAMMNGDWRPFCSQTRTTKRYR